MADEEQNKQPETGLPSGSGAQPAAQKSGRFSLMQHTKPLKLGLIVAGLLLLGATGWLLFRDMTGDGDGNQAQVSICTDESVGIPLEDVRAALNPYTPNRLETLAKASQQVQQVAGYDKDSGCLFFVASSYIAAGNAAKSRETLEQLKAVHSGGDFQGAYSETVSLDDLEAEVTQLEKSLEETANNAQFFGAPVTTGEEE